MGGSAGVEIKEVDKSVRVPSFPGVYCGCVVVSPKGPTEPTLVTRAEQLYDWFLPKGKTFRGLDTSFYTAAVALQATDKLWVVRVHNNALYGGFTIATPLDLDNNLTTGQATGTLSVGISNPETYLFVQDEILFLYGANPGAWNNDIGIKLFTRTDTSRYQEELTQLKTQLQVEAFVIEVYLRENLNTPVEVHVVSRQKGARDGFGKNIYVESSLKSSAYIRALDKDVVNENEVPSSVSTISWLGGGDNGAVVTSGQVVAGLNHFSNTDEIPLFLLLDSGWTIREVHNKIVTICESRKDCFGVCSVPYSAEASANYLTEIVDYRRNVWNPNSSFAALYTGHCKIFDKDIDDSFFIPPTGFVASAISRTASNYEVWFPPAGWRRGKLNVLDVRRRFTRGEKDALYNAGINPIRFAPGRGVAIWGQKTLHALPSALDRINVRLMLIVIQQAIAVALEDWQFELNTYEERERLRIVVTNYLNLIKARKGLYDFYVLCDETNNPPQVIDNHELNVDVFVKPTRSIEFITLRTIITSTGMDFALLK